MTKKHAVQYFICSLNFKSHNFQTESHFKRVTPTYRGSTTLSFLVLQLCLTLRTLWIQTLLTLSSAFCERPIFSVPDHPIGCTCGIGTSKFFFWDKENFAFCKSSSHNSSGWVRTSSAKVFFQETPAWYRTLAARQNEYHPQNFQRVE